MENNDVIVSLEELLTKSKEPIPYKKLLISTRASLRKLFIKKNIEHLNNKLEFEKYWFKKALNSEDGKAKFKSLERGKKIALKGWHALDKIGNDQLEGISSEDAIEYMTEFIKHIHHTKLEELVGRVIEKRYGYKKDIDHPSCKLTGDSGLDFYGTKLDNEDHKRKQVFMAQVKQQRSNIDRSLAQNLHGAVDEALLEKKFTKVMALFVTTGGYSQGFKELISQYSKPGITYIYWDGPTLAQKIVGTGIGYKFQLEKEYWMDLDPDIFEHIAKARELTEA